MKNPLVSIKEKLDEYPSQFWLLFGGLFISILGMSMIWPFLMIYVKGKLGLPMTQVASLMTAYSVAALIFAFISGPIIDKIGRKWTMVFSLVATGIAFLLMIWADNLLEFALLMALRGVVGPMFRIAADAMQADLIPPEKRADSYALTRMSQNAAVALGPAIGGFMAAISYSYSFYIAFGGLVLTALLIALLAVETRPKEEAVDQSETLTERFSGYGKIFRDRPFIGMVGGFTVATMCSALLWVLLGVYVIENFGMTESQFGLIPMTNALMVVVLQVAVTKRSKHRPPMLVMSAGTFLYGLGVASVAYGTGFWGFWLSMVVLTFGELLLVPTATTFAANLAPADMRGRYMSIHSLSWQLASGFGPLLGGLLNDNISPQATWLGGGLAGLLTAVYFLRIGLKERHRQPLAVK